MSRGHQENPAANEFFPQVRHFQILGWYCQLRVKARNHIESSLAPMLSLAPKPDTMKQWQV